MRSGRKAGRSVKRVLADGSVKIYRYGAYRGPRSAAKGETVDGLMQVYEHSVEWRALSQSSQATYARYLKYLGKIGHLEAVKIKRAELLDLRDAVAEARGDGAAQTFMNAVGAFFTWAVKRGKLEVSPCYKIDPLPGGEYPAWSWDELELALQHLREPLRRAVILLLYTGQRRGDVCHMTWADYNGSRIRVRQQKTGEPLVIPCHPSLSAELDAWRHIAPTILTNNREKPWRPSHISNALFHALAQIPGFPAHRNTHGLRKLAAATLAEAGCSTHEIMAITGHKSLAMVELYTASARQEKLATAAVLRFPALKGKL